MSTIYKYPLASEVWQIVQMPRGAKPLTVQVQRGLPCLWALVDPNEPEENYKVATVGTGHPFDDKRMEYVATYQVLGGDLVFHVFVEI